MSRIFMAGIEEPDTPASGTVLFVDTSGRLYTKSSAGVLIPYSASLIETGGPTVVHMGEWPEGTYLRRVGTTAVGDTPVGGSGDAPAIDVVEGFNTSNYYRSATSQLLGNDVFSAVWYGWPGWAHDDGGGQFLMGNSNTDGWGWSIGFSGRSSGSDWYINFTVADVDEELIGLSVTVREAVAPFTRPVHLAIVWDGTSEYELRVYVDGCAQRFNPNTSSLNGGFTPVPSGRFTIGNDPAAWNEPHVSGGCAGAGYVGSVLTMYQVQEHLQACRDAGHRMAAGAVSWAHRYDARDPGGSFPGTWNDLAGSAHLERVGSAITATRERAV